MTLRHRVRRLEQRDEEDLDFDLDALVRFLDSLRDELAARGLDPDLVTREGTVHVEGDSNQYCATLEALRGVAHHVAPIGRPLRWEFPCPHSFS